MPRPAPLLLVLAFVGCEPGPGRPTATDAPPAPLGLSTDRATYAAGDSLALRLVPEAEVTYNLSHATLERRGRGGWERYRGEYLFISAEDRRRGAESYVRNDMGYIGRGGETARYALRLSDRLEPGTYRFRHAVQRSSALGETVSVWDTLATPPFEIR